MALNADAFNFDGGSTLDNSGTINATTIGDQGLDISTPGSGTNHATGIINITGVRNEEAIDVTGTFTNDGVLNISDIQLLLTSGQSAIHVNSATGSFINNNLINLALTKADSIAIEVDVDADLTNSVCAVINITTENPIINNGTNTNEGTISTVFSGTNTNTGIFINNGVIASPNSLFKIGGTDNALIGTGAVQTSTTGIISGSTTVCTGTNSTLLTLSEHSGTIQNWESSTDINFSSPTTIMNMLTTYTAMDLTGTTYYRAVIKNGACDAVNSGIVTITVDQPSVGGTVIGSTTVCTGTNSTTLALIGKTGTIQNWESSTDIGFSSPTTISNTTNTIEATNLIATTYYRAVVKNGACDAANSSIATVTVDPTSVGGTIAGAATVCTGTNSTLLTLSGHTGEIQNWESSTDINFISPAPTTIANTNTTLTVENLTTTTHYRAVIKSGVCSSVNSGTTTVTVSADPLTVGGTISGATIVCTGTNSTDLTLSGHTGSILRWESATDNIFTSPSTINNTTTSITETNLTQTTYYRAVVQSGVCNLIYSDTVAITVDAASVGGSVSGTTTVCTGTNSTFLVLSGHTGTIQNWESSTDLSFSSPTTIANTTTSYIAEDLTSTTYYRAVVKSGVCVSANSSLATVTVDAASVLIQCLSNANVVNKPEFSQYSMESC